MPVLLAARGHNPPGIAAEVYRHRQGALHRPGPPAEHPSELPHARRAARCAAAVAPGSFEAFHDSLFAHHRGATADTVQALAAAVGPPQPAFSQCASSNRFDAAIAADVATAERVGFTGTPSFVIGRTTGGDSLTGMTMTGAY
ncbi:MAG: thioredoxin domain-containing protein, partial [Gemmatimonadota bacterium]